MCHTKIALCTTCTVYRQSNLILCHIGMTGKICIKPNAETDKSITINVNIHNDVRSIDINEILDKQIVNIICISCTRLRNYRSIASVLESKNT